MLFEGAWHACAGALEHEGFMMNVKFFTSACILGGGLLVKFGAPVPTVALGMALAFLFEWKRGSITRKLGRGRGRV